MKPIQFLLFLVLLLFACNNDSDVPDEQPAQDSSEMISQGPENIEAFKPFKMKTNIDNLRIRASAGEQGQEIGRLKEGSVVYGLGEASDFKSKIKLRGITYNEPWLKIKTEQGLEGWVFAGALSFEIKDLKGLPKQIFNQRLESFFGGELSGEINKYRTAYYQAKTSQEFADNYRLGTNLKDTLISIMENKLPVPEDYNQMPDLFWVENALPGYVTQLVAEGTLFHLFKDFNVLMEKARETQGTEDDDFIDLNLTVHSADSIEYFFPSWFIQTWDYGGSSLLGQGQHIKVLKKINTVLNKSDLFIVEALETKDLLINDMTSADMSYWEPKRKIIKEIDEILSADLNILTNDDRIALETRRKQFKDPIANNIRVNHRSGE